MAKWPIDVLMSECRTIQKNLKNFTRASNPDYIAKTFAKHILNGKINAALRLLDNAESTGVLPLNQSVLNSLKANIQQPESLIPRY